MQASGLPFTRQDLERLKRVDIQRICKEYGVKANMKTEALIELLLDTIRSNISPLVQPPRPPQPQPESQPRPAPTATTIRRVSTRSRTTSRTSSGTRTRGTSGSSVIIHDTEDESQAEQSSTTQVSESVASSSRVRKAKATQLRLGVGRPVIAGGQGARAVTRATSVVKGKRTRVSTISRPVEETIEEEPELSATDALPSIDALPSMPPVNESPSSAFEPQVNSRIEKLESLLNDMNLKQQFETLKEATAQIDWLKSSLQKCEVEILNVRGELQACRVEVMVLRNETAKIPALENHLRALKENFDKARNGNVGSPSKTQTARRVSIPLGESNTNSLLPSPSIQPAPAKVQMPGPTETTLGKRHRDSAASNITGVSESGGSIPGKDQSKRVLRPSRKRTRTDELTNPGESSNPSGKSTESDSRSPEHDSADDSGTGSSAPSTVPPIGTPPPTNHLPELFGASIDAEQHTPKNYDNYPTDSGLLGFSFSHAASSTPREDVFGYVDEPFSPGSALRAGVRPTTATSNNGGLRPGPFGDRLGSPSPSPRPRTPSRQNMNSPGMVPQYRGSPFEGMDETTDYVLHFTDPDRRESGSTVPLPIALGYSFNEIMGVPPLDDSPERPSQRTMYGTEVQNDTRFGEFGCDGIAGSATWFQARLFS